MSLPSTFLEAFHRRLCAVTERLLVSGDLPTGPEQALAHLKGWVDAGITHVVDCRLEWSDEEFVAVHAPQIDYAWLGTHDDGENQSCEWFDAGVESVTSALSDPNARVLVHCHMGINRAPSMAFAVLLAMGFEPVAALNAIRTARPIAALLYAQDALNWWHTRSNAPALTRLEQQTAVVGWMNSHQLDVDSTIRRIRAAEGGHLDCSSTLPGGSVRPIRFNDLVEVVAEETGLPSAQALEILEILEGQLAEAFEAGRSILLPLVGLLDPPATSTEDSAAPALTLADFAEHVGTACSINSEMVGAAIDAVAELLDSATDEVATCYVPLVGDVPADCDLAVDKLGSARSSIWLIQCNPKVKDVEAERRLSGELPLNWSVSIRAAEIQPGDRVVFWISGSRAGVYALGEVTDAARTRLMNEEGLLSDNHPKWDTFVGFDLYLDLFDCPIDRGELKADARFANEPIIVRPWAANAHRVSASGFEAILERAASRCFGDRARAG
jgi:protein-tyrosine phosphatase